MTIEQVIQAAQFTPEHYFDWGSITGWGWFGFALVTIFALFVFLIFLWIEENKFFATISLLSIPAIFLMMGSDLTEFNKVKWENEYVKPYYNSIPFEKYEIVYVKIDPEISNETRGSIIFGSGYINTSTENLTPLVVSYKENGRVITYSNWLDTQMVLTDEDKPYIEFKRVPSNLGHDYNAGIYEVKVYLPEGYEFTDIK
jgi:hypothetical protein